LFFSFGHYLFKDDVEKDEKKCRINVEYEYQGEKFIIENVCILVQKKDKDIASIQKKIDGSKGMEVQTFKFDKLKYTTKNKK